MDDNTTTLLREVPDSLHNLQIRIDGMLHQVPVPAGRGCSQCGASLIGKRSDARICGSPACKKSAKEDRVH